MSRKFSRMIAKEEFEGAGAVDLVEGDGEAAIIENEVNEDVGEVDHDNEEIEVISEGIEDASADAEQLEGIEGALTEAMDDPDHPGLDSVAVEAISAVLTMIQRNRGFNVTATRNIVAKENFDGSVAVRRTNTRAVLLSVGDTLKSIWESIKNALKTLWEKIKKFWAKHIATLGRLKKACEAMKKKINSTKGSPNLSKDVDAPSSFKRLFPGESEINITVMKKFADRLTNESSKITSTLDDVVDLVSVVTAKSADAVIAKEFADMKSGEKVSIGTNEEPLIGGFYGELEVEVEDISTEKKKQDKFRMQFNKEQSDLDSSEDVDFVIGTKNELISAVDSARQIVINAQALQKFADKSQKAFDKAMREIDTKVNDEYSAKNDEEGKRISNNARDVAKLFRIAGSVVPSVNSKLVSLMVSQIKAQLQYCSISLSKYKKLGK